MDTLRANANQLVLGSIAWFVTDAVVDMDAVKRNDERFLFHYKVSTWELN